MERRFQVRFEELMADAVVSPVVLHGMLPRLQRFVAPFAACLGRVEQRINAEQYLGGLVSSLERKNAESIAYHYDRERQVSAEVHRELALGPRAAADDTRHAGGGRAGRSRRRHRVRSVGVRQKRKGVGGGATAVVRSPGEGRELSGRRVHGLCVAHRACFGERPTVPSRAVGQRQLAAEKMRDSEGRAVSDAARTGACDAG